MFICLNHQPIISTSTKPCPSVQHLPFYWALPGWSDTSRWATCANSSPPFLRRNFFPDIKPLAKLKTITSHAAIFRSLPFKGCPTDHCIVGLQRRTWESWWTPILPRASSMQQTRPTASMVAQRRALLGSDSSLLLNTGERINELKHLICEEKLIAGNN